MLRVENVGRVIASESEGEEVELEEDFMSPAGEENKGIGEENQQRRDEKLKILETIDLTKTSSSGSGMHFQNL